MGRLRGHPNFSSAASDTSSAAGFGPRGYYGGRRTYSDFGEEHHYANTAHLRGLNGGPGSVDSPFSDTNYSYSRNPTNPPESILKNGTLPRANRPKPFMNGYGVRGGGNPGLSNGGLNGGLNGDLNGDLNGLNGGVGSLDNGLIVAADEDDNAITTYYDEEVDGNVGVTSPLLGNGTAIAMAAGNGNVTGAALEPEMMQVGTRRSYIRNYFIACH